MIKILPLRDKQILNSLNLKEGTNAALAFCLYDADEIDGYILYNITEQSGEVVLVKASDDSMVDGLIRAVLASLYDFGINSVTFSDAVDMDIVRKLNIVKPNEITVPSIKDILYNCKNCQKNK